MVVGSTLADSTYGQSVSFTVTVSGGGPMPTGTVQFVVDGTDLGSRGGAVGRKCDQPEHDASGCGQSHGAGGVLGRLELRGEHGQLHAGRQPGEPDSGGRQPEHESLRCGAALTYHYTGFVNGDNASTVRDHRVGEFEYHGHLEQPRRLLPDPPVGQFLQRLPTTRSEERKTVP